MRIGILTSRTARPIIESVLSRFSPRRGVELVVIELPVPAVGVIPVRSLGRIASKHARRILDSVDLVIVPGLSRGAPGEFTEETGVPAVKGPKDPGLLPAAIEMIVGGRLSPGERDIFEADEASLPAVRGEIAFMIDGLAVPRRGPPMLLAVELAYSVVPERLEREAARVACEGADLVVVGSRRGAPEGEVMRRFEAVRRGFRGPIVCEPGKLENLPGLWRAGCKAFTVSATGFRSVLGRGYEWVDRALWIVGDRDVGELARASIEARRSGVDRVILDPVVGLPMIDLAETVPRYREAARLGRPLLFSAANALTEASADPHGAQLVLASLAAELGASVYLVVEDGLPTLHSTSEARHALGLVARASLLGSTPRSPDSPLLIVRQEHEPPPPPRGWEGAVRVEGWIEPRMDRGHFLVFVDHARGMILVEYREGRSVRRWEGREPRSLMRAVLRSVDVSREHAGYLGFELHKAWLALRAGKTYLQDEPVLVLPWERRSDEASGC